MQFLYLDHLEQWERLEHLALMANLDFLELLGQKERRVTWDLQVRLAQLGCLEPLHTTHFLVMAVKVLL